MKGVLWDLKWEWDRKIWLNTVFTVKSSKIEITVAEEKKARERVHKVNMSHQHEKWKRDHHVEPQGINRITWEAMTTLCYKHFD